MPPPAPVTAATREQENRAYDVGSNLFKRGDYLAATRAFQAFMKDFPSSGLVPNAQYWIGISYFNLRDYGNARSIPGNVVEASTPILPKCRTQCWRLPA